MTSGDSAGMPTTEVYSPNRSLTAKFRRRLVQLVKASPLPASPPRPIVSFTFDDFPRSAADIGAEIVENFGGHATYYACSGMAGQKSITGSLYLPEDILSLQRAGHEIAGHTHSHLDCATNEFKTVIQDIDRSDAALGAMGISTVQHFAYPFGETTVELKRYLATRYRTARGIRAGLNRRGTDTMQLRALEISAEEWTVQRAARAIDRAARSNSWAILFTHDVRDNPSAFGTTPEILRNLARLSRDAGAAILPVGRAFEEIVAAATP